MSLNHTDAYKLSHKGFMNEGTEKIYSNMTPRSSAYLPVLKEFYEEDVVVFGLQYFIKDYLMSYWNEQFFFVPKKRIIPRFKRLFDAYLGEGVVSMEHFEALHDLGYLPIKIKALKEGTVSKIGVPVLTITNTHKDFAWLTNYLESVMSCELWKPMVTATLVREYRKMMNKYAMETTGSTEGTEFQLHGFEFRGMSGRHDAAINGAAFLLSSCGTDTIPALDIIEDYYDTDITKEFIATSVPASEHSVASLGTSVEGELASYRRWITESYPTGIVSLVSDTYDYWKVLTEYLPILKEDILARKKNALGLSKVCLRPDSGCPKKIICGDPDALEGSPEHKGSIQILWEIFGGTTSPQGYKILDEHIGLVYGDSITLERAFSIIDGLKQNGFASTNIVLGVGSYTMNYLTRDSLGIAIKATYAEVNGKGIELYKDPKTDDGTKKSAKGLLKVIDTPDGLRCLDQMSTAEEKEGLLEDVFIDGTIVRLQTFTEIRNLIWS